MTATRVRSQVLDSGDGVSAPLASSTPSPVAAATPAPGATLAPNVGMPSQPGAPACPAGFTPLGRAAVRALIKPTPPQVTGATAVAAEIVASPTFDTDFTRAMPGEDFASQLDTAYAWSVEERAARLYLRFATAQKLLAWDAAMRSGAAVQSEFAYASQHDATVAARYPHLGEFITGKKVVAARGIATRRARAKAKAAARALVAPAAPAVVTTRAAPAVVATSAPAPAPANTQGPRAA